MESPRLLIRRDAQRNLSFAIAWFLAVPSFVLGFLTLLAPIAGAIPVDCVEAACPPRPDPFAPPAFLLPGSLALVAVAGGCLFLYRLTYRQPRLAWSLVAAIGGALIAAALVADLVWGLRTEVALATFIWPITPGLMAIDGARRFRSRIVGDHGLSSARAATIEGE